MERRRRRPAQRRRPKRALWRRNVAAIRRDGRGLMQLYPTTNAVHVAAAGIAVVGAGVLLGEPAVLSWGGAMLVGLAVARAVTLIGVTRVRAAGFEMLWRETARVRRIGR